MAQMGFAHGTHGFGTQHTVGAVNPFFDGGWVRSLVKLGQPQPASNLVLESNNLASQQMHW